MVDYETVSDLGFMGFIFLSCLAVLGIVAIKIAYKEAPHLPNTFSAQWKYADGIIGRFTVDNQNRQWSTITGKSGSIYLNEKVFYKSIKAFLLSKGWFVYNETHCTVNKEMQYTEWQVQSSAKFLGTIQVKNMVCDQWEQQQNVTGVPSTVTYCMDGDVLVRLNVSNAVRNEVWDLDEFIRYIPEGAFKVPETCPQ